MVALFNTLHRVAESLDAVQNFRQMYAEREAEAEAAKAAAAAEERGRERQHKPTRKHELATTRPTSWCDSASVGTALLAVLEALRRSCKGCVGAIARWLARSGAGTGKVEL